jgi:hypothetical protein
MRDLFVFVFFTRELILEFSRESFLDSRQYLSNGVLEGVRYVISFHCLAASLWGVKRFVALSLNTEVWLMGHGLSRFQSSTTRGLSGLVFGNSQNASSSKSCQPSKMLTMLIRDFLGRKGILRSTALSTTRRIRKEVIALTESCNGKTFLGLIYLNVTEEIIVTITNEANNNLVINNKTVSCHESQDRSQSDLSGFGTASLQLSLGVSCFVLKPNLYPQVAGVEFFALCGKGA